MIWASRFLDLQRGSIYHHPLANIERESSCNLAFPWFFGKVKFSQSALNLFVRWPAKSNLTAPICKIPRSDPTRRTAWPQKFQFAGFSLNFKVFWICILKCVIVRPDFHPFVKFPRPDPNPAARPDARPKFAKALPSRLDPTRWEQTNFHDPEKFRLFEKWKLYNCVKIKTFANMLYKQPLGFGKGGVLSVWAAAKSRRHDPNLLAIFVHQSSSVSAARQLIQRALPQRETNSYCTERIEM